MIKLSNIFERILIEGRVDDFKAKYTSIPDPFKDIIIKNDPSSNHKYLDWIGKIVTSTPNIEINPLLQDVSIFDKYQASLGDIYKYTSYDDLKHAISTRIKSNKEKMREGAEILIDDDNFLIVAPKTYESCGHYGNNTRWCIAGSEEWFNTYFYKNTIIILYDKRSNEKYAVISDESYGDPTINDRNDHMLDYSSFVGDDDEDNDDVWPEYVHDKINDYISNDDIESRKYKHQESIINEYIADYGTDQVWENYLECVNKEFDIDIVEDLNLFKKIALDNHQITENDLKSYAISYLWYKINENDDVDDIGDIHRTNEIENALDATGELYKQGKDSPLEYIVGDYVRVIKRIDIYLNMIESAVGTSEYYKLYNIEDIDNDLTNAINKYNNKLNQSSQSKLNGIPYGKESVHINNIHDIINLFKHTGYENVATKLESLIRIFELKSYFNSKYNNIIS